MEELERKLLEAWDARPEREKVMFSALALIVVAWFSWSYVIKGNLKKFWTAHKTLVKAEAEYKETVQFHKNVAAFKKKQADLEADLRQKVVKEDEFNRRIKAQGQLEDVMEGLRSEAGKSSLKLVTLDVKTTDTASSSGKAEDKGANRRANAFYKRNNIILVCRGPYRQTVEYFLKVMDMPRILSLTSLSISKAVVPAANGGAPESKPGPAGAVASTLETRLELEVLFK